MSNADTSGAVSRPLLLSLALVGTAGFALGHALSQVDLAAVPVYGRYLANPLCRMIAGLWTLTVIYALFQWVGARALARLVQSGAAPGPVERFWLWPSARRLGRPGGGGLPRDLVVEQRAREAHARGQPLQFAVWALPMLGFTGTVLGITDAVEGLGVMLGHTGGVQTEAMAKITRWLHFAFDSTLVALVLVMPLRLIADWVELDEHRLSAALEQAAAGPDPRTAATPCASDST